MLDAFMEKAPTLIGRRFMVGYWMPSLLFAVFLFFDKLTVAWLGLSFQSMLSLDKTQLLLAALAYLLFTILLAYLLEAFTRSSIRFYEGYWPHLFRRLFVLLQRRQWRKLHRKLREAASRGSQDFPTLQARAYREFPWEEGRVLPTQLGNVMRAAEEYSNRIYGLDGVFWWSRLEPLLPDTMQERLDAVFTALVALLNLTTLSLVGLLIVAVNAWQMALPWRQWLTPVVGLVMFGWLAHQGALVQALNFGDLVRVAYDHHRFAILDALNIPRPKDLRAERELWQKLYDWLYQWDLGSGLDVGAYRHNIFPE